MSPAAGGREPAGKAGAWKSDSPRSDFQRGSSVPLSDQPSTSTQTAPTTTTGGGGGDYTRGAAAGASSGSSTINSDI